MRAGYLLRAFRESRNLTAKEIAVALKCHPTMVAYLENHRRRPGLALAVRIERMTDGWAKGPIRPWMWVESDAADAKEAA